MNMIYMKQHPASLLRQFISLPIFLGHENVSQIEEVGSAVKEFSPGQRVVIDPPMACAARKIDPPCPACVSGRPSVCLNFDRGVLGPALGLGYNNFTGGSWSTTIVAHASQIHMLPDELSDEEAILIDPLACSLHAVLRDLPANNERILVFGSGIIALGVILAIRALELPVKITATVRYPFQAELAERCGADNVVFWKRSEIESAMKELAELSGARNLVGSMKMRFFQGGFDRLYDCTGRIGGLVEAMRMLKPGGRLIVSGTPQLGLIDTTSLWFRELTMIGATGRAVETLPGESEPRHDYEHIIGLILRKKINLAPLPVTLYRPEEYRRAFGDLQNRGKTKIIKSAFDFRF